MRANNDIFPLNQLPIDILMQIFSSFTLENFSHMQLVNQELRISAKHNQLWQHRFIQHFPHTYKKLDVKNISNWYDQFHTTYQNEYPDEKSKKLFSLVKEERFDELKKILQFNDVNIKDKNGMGLSQWICEANNQPFLDYCYRLVCEFAYGNYNSRNRHPKSLMLVYAAAFNQISEIHHLVPQIANINLPTPFVFNAAIAHKHIDVIHALLTLGLDPNLTIDPDSGLAGILLGSQYTPLHYAALVGDLEITNALLAHGVNIDATITPWNETPLMTAAIAGHTDIVNILLEHGANIDISHLLGTTSLSFAKFTGHNEIALAIVKQKLRNYLKIVNPRNDDDYKTYSIFNHSFNLSFFGACSAKQKKDAAEALAQVYLNGIDESLDAHKNALNHGELGSIYDDLKSLTEAVASKNIIKLSHI